MKLVMVFAFDVPEDSDVIQEIMRTTATRLIAMGGISKDYSPQSYVAIKDAAEAVLEVFKPNRLEPVGSEPSEVDSTRVGIELVLADVEKFIKRQREQWRDGEGNRVQKEWHALDRTLDAFREHVATGTPLDQELTHESDE